MCGIWCFLGSGFDMSLYIESIESLKDRGPDSTCSYQDDDLALFFHRLAIHDPSVMGLQPFYHSDDVYDYILVCNGEIYNEKELRTYFSIETVSKSDCSILLPLFLKVDQDFASMLDFLRGEYAIVLIRKKKKTKQKDIFMATDPLGVRPIFFSVDSNRLIISSLVKGFLKEDEKVERLSPRDYLHALYTPNEKIHLTRLDKNPCLYGLQENNICQVLIDCVRRRLSSDRPLGCLLSGGLDSSLVAAIAAKELKRVGKTLRTFSIGMKNSPDLYYARLVADHIQSDHTEFIMTEEEGIEVIKDVIWAIESWDTTTIRASVPQFLLAKKIRETTKVKVLLNGDGADECQMGYLYFHRSPSIEEALEERNRILNDIYYFDGLRVDRCITRFGLEARTPFLDKEFVRVCRNLPAEFLVPTKHRMEKFYIRDKFQTHYPDLLPSKILWRTKEAFSDGISPSHKSWFSTLKSNWDNEESYYRHVFEDFFGKKKVIPYRWMPRWTNTDDPSARTLDFYSSQESKEKIS